MLSTPEGSGREGPDGQWADSQESRVLIPALTQAALPQETEKLVVAGGTTKRHRNIRGNIIEEWKSGPCLLNTQSLFLSYSLLTLLGSPASSRLNSTGVWGRLTHPQTAGI